MPAPVPINIRYGSPADLGALAAASGSAQYARQNQLTADDRAYQDFLTRQSLDNSFLMQQQQIAADTNNRNNELNVRLATLNSGGARALQDAAGYGQPVGSTYTNDVGQANANAQQAAALAARQSAQKTGSALRNGANPTLVPAEGPLNPDGSGYIDSGGIRAESYNGSVLSYPVGDTTTRDLLRANTPPQTPKPELVSPDARTQLDYLKQLQGQIPADQWNALWVAAKSGGLKLDQVVDDARAAIPSPTAAGPKSTLDRNLDKYSAEATELSQVAQLSPKDQAQYARRRFGMQDPDIYSDQDALAALNSRGRQLQALTQPVQNSGGKTPSGGNVVTVTSPDQARALPKGTYFKTPDGRLMRVP